jgi:hypothetical protein
MLRKDTSVDSFDDLLRPSKDAWAKLVGEFRDLFHDRDPAVVYGVPGDLLDALAEDVPDLFDFNKDALSFEYRLADFFQQHYSVGLVHGRLIRSSLFEERAPLTISSEDFHALGWEQFGLTQQKANHLCSELESRSAQFHEQAVAYAGWLVTNPQFLNEVTAIREGKRELLTMASDFETAIKLDPEMNAFCAKWQLAGMASWDLPEPQGPNLAGIRLPESARRGDEQVNLELPLTMRLPARVPIRDIVAEIRVQAASPHLAEWQEILDRSKGRSGPGESQFATILQIQFFRNIVLESRYGERFSGRVQALDRAFSRFVGLEEDSIKKLRLEIQRRLGRS